MTRKWRRPLVGNDPRAPAQFAASGNLLLAAAATSGASDAWQRCAIASRHHGGDVKIASVKGALPNVLQVTGLNKLFEIYPDVNRARLAFRPKAAEGT